MRQKYSIREDQKQFREIVLNNSMNHWEKVSKMYLLNTDVQKLISFLKTECKMVEPYATNVAMRFLTNAWNVIQKTK